MKKKTWKIGLGPLDLKSRPSPHYWVRRNPRESTNFHFGPVEEVSQDRKRRRKLHRCTQTAIDSARRDSRLFFQTFKPGFVISWRTLTNERSLESLRSQQSDGAIFAPVSPRERTIAPFLGRVLTLSAQFPRIRTCSGQCVQGRDRGEMLCFLDSHRGSRWYRPSSKCIQPVRQLIPKKIQFSGVNCVSFASSWSASQHAKHRPTSLLRLSFWQAQQPHASWRRWQPSFCDPQTSLGLMITHLTLSNCRTSGMASCFIHRIFKHSVFDYPASAVNLYPPKGRFLWRISFKFSPKASFDILNNILESGFDFHVSSLGSTNVPMWERWERDDKNLPDFENMKKTYSSKAKC